MFPTANVLDMQKVLKDLGFEHMYTWYESHGDGCHQFWQGPDLPYLGQLGSDRCMTLYINREGRLTGWREEKMRLRLAQRLVVMDAAIEEWEKSGQPAQADCDARSVHGEDIDHCSCRLLVAIDRLQKQAKMERNDAYTFATSWSRKTPWSVSPCSTSAWADFDYRDLYEPSKVKTYRLHRTAGHPADLKE